MAIAVMGASPAVAASMDTTPTPVQSAAAAPPAGVGSPPEATPSGPTTATTPTSAPPPAVPPATTPTPSTTPPVAPTPDVPTDEPAGSDDGPEAPSLSPAEIARQVRAAEALRRQLAANNAELSAALATLDQLNTNASAALERHAEAKAAARTATEAAAAATAEADRLTVELARDKQQLTAWAFNAYAEGGSTADMVTVFESMSTDPDRASDPVGDLAFLTDARLRAFHRVQTLTHDLRQAADRAVHEQGLADRALDLAETAKAEADRLLADQTALVDDIRERHARTIAEAGPMTGLLLGMSAPRTTAMAKGLRDELRASGVFGTIGGQPCSDDDTAYPNGMLPTSALCPLAEAPGHRMNPRAALAFDAMSRAYAADFGSPICVTDSYRSFEQQIVVKASRGFWAATPGRSLHGLGIAIDLCGGINDFGTTQHLWMLQNAPRFGFYHPNWASAGGSKPEPWHWEFAG